MDLSDLPFTGSDVFAGSILGIGVALVTRFGIAKNFDGIKIQSHKGEILPIQEDRVSGVTSF